jgi:hypothetical protein
MNLSMGHRSLTGARIETTAAIDRARFSSLPHGSAD